MSRSRSALAWQGEGGADLAIFGLVPEAYLPFMVGKDGCRASVREMRDGHRFH
ncbi:hypothetical protein STRTUCAR8_00640 [Streptomyces turgidiscabies Car8]|uniref:Uncharacterized protein n=1 Tax=Streptomyces turgidiscabies (strain Car8) TaxID=698760 RepID=L7FH98_STRT8|nr:hypothetical protein STRTUCAR8_00640 [Streptomyces turgidiscabies Car8]